MKICLHSHSEKDVAEEARSEVDAKINAMAEQIPLITSRIFQRSGYNNNETNQSPFFVLYEKPMDGSSLF